MSVYPVVEVEGSAQPQGSSRDAPNGVVVELARFVCGGALAVVESPTQTRIDGQTVDPADSNAIRMDEGQACVEALEHENTRQETPALHTSSRQRPKTSTAHHHSLHSKTDENLVPLKSTVYPADSHATRMSGWEVWKYCNMRTLHQ
mmetsp:Transcript_58212/g.155014  ORF Transcript_58212/g.155014 Transcript_58212/m.155014 type:complete len:147 (+) Transcript_58212:1492-1932(+)